MNCQPVPEIAICFGVYGHDAATSWIFYPEPEHECSTATRNQLAIGEFDANGDGHWTASYMKMAYGEANCPEGKRITTAAECRYAHMALGLEIDPEWNGHYDRESVQAAVCVCVSSQYFGPISRSESTIVRSS